MVYNDNIDPIGYWPPTEFKQLAEGADTLKWGGYVFTQPGDNTNPPMGSGHFDDGSYVRSCFMNQLQYTDSNFDLKSPTDVQTSCQMTQILIPYHVGDNSYKDDTHGYRLIAFVLADHHNYFIKKKKGLKIRLGNMLSKIVSC